jgi:hypothetical protein
VLLLPLAEDEDVYVSKENIWAIVEFCYWNCANN